MFECLTLPPLILSPEVSRSMNRLKTQSPANYALSSLSRLMDGLITVPIATTMFSDPANAPCPVVIAKTIVTVS